MSFNTSFDLGIIKKYPVPNSREIVQWEQGLQTIVDRVSNKKYTFVKWSEDGRVAFLDGTSSVLSSACWFVVLNEQECDNADFRRDQLGFPEVPEYIELNMGNYSEDNVAQLNAWGIWANSEIDELRNTIEELKSRILELQLKV
jgi:hypothetical protein